MDAFQGKSIPISILPVLNADLFRGDRLRFRHNICYPLLHDCCMSVDEIARDGTRCSHAGGSAALACCWQLLPLCSLTGDIIALKGALPKRSLDCCLRQRHLHHRVLTRFATAWAHVAYYIHNNTCEHSYTETTPCESFISYMQRCSVRVARKPCAQTKSSSPISRASPCARDSIHRIVASMPCLRYVKSNLFETHLGQS